MGESGLGNEQSYHVDYSVLENNLAKGNLSYYNDFYIEKYQTATPFDIIEHLEDELAQGDKRYNFKNYDLTQENIDLLKEEMLEGFVKSWIYDW